MHIKDWLPDARELRHAPALIGLEKLTTLLWSMAVTAIGLGFVWWFGGPPTPFGWVIVVLSLFIRTPKRFRLTPNVSYRRLEASGLIKWKRRGVKQSDNDPRKSVL